MQKYTLSGALPSSVSGLLAFTLAISAPPEHVTAAGAAYYTAAVSAAACTGDQHGVMFLTS